MKLKIEEFKKHIPKFSWSAEKLADELSIIGHEAEVHSKNALDVSLTSNRKDCQDLKYLAFDLIAFHDELGSNDSLIKFKQNKKIKVTLEKINKILGSNVSFNDYKKIEKLGFKVSENEVVVPDFRVDIFEGADISEEVFRMVEVNAIKVKPLDKQPAGNSKEYDFLNSVRAALSAIGASETRTISFSRRGKYPLKNPFSNSIPYMQETLLYGLLETVGRNPYLRRSFFYEIGNVFNPKELTKIGFIVTGYKKTEPIEKALREVLGIAVRFKDVENNLLEEFSVKQPRVKFVELDVNDIKLSRDKKYISSGMPEYKKISKYPPLSRDVSLIDVDIDKLKNSFENLLITELIDSYKKPQTDKQTDTYRLIFQKMDSSFTQKEITEIDKKISTFI